MINPNVSVGREIASYLLRIVFTVLLVIMVLGVASLWFEEESVSDGVCNVAVVPLEGVIMPYGEALAIYGDVVTPNLIRDQVEKAEKDSLIKGILFEVDSPGGTPVASLKINEIIKSTTLPTVSLIGDMGASGAYLASVASDKIFASRMSSVGGIGVTMSYTENSKRNEEKGITFVELSTGEFKDAGSKEKPLTEAERKKFEAELQEIHTAFVEVVSEDRDLPFSDVEKIANGSTLVGKQAKEAGLIDEIGGRKEVKAEFAKILNLEEEKVVFCKAESKPFSF